MARGSSRVFTNVQDQSVAICRRAGIQQALLHLPIRGRTGLQANLLGRWISRAQRAVKDCQKLERRRLGRSLAAGLRRVSLAALSCTLLTPTALSVKGWEAKRDARTLEVHQLQRQFEAARHSLTGSETTQSRADKRWITYEAHCRYTDMRSIVVVRLTCIPSDSWELSTMTRNDDRRSWLAGVTTRCLHRPLKGRAFLIISACDLLRTQLSCPQRSRSTTISPVEPRKARHRLHRSLRIDRLDFPHLHRLLE